MNIFQFEKYIYDSKEMYCSSMSLRACAKEISQLEINFENYLNVVAILTAFWVF